MGGGVGATVLGFAIQLGALIGREQTFLFSLLDHCRKSTMAFGFSALSKLKGRDFDGSAGRLKKRKEASSRRPDPHDPFAHGAAIHRALHPDAVSGGGSIAAHYSTHSFLQRFGKDQLLESAPALVDDDEPRGDNGNNSSVSNCANHT